MGAVLLLLAAGVAALTVVTGRLPRLGALATGLPGRSSAAAAGRRAHIGAALLSGPLTKA